jgi:uncharacterized protein YnzC (UPF0291/DUF896 family)
VSFPTESTRLGICAMRKKAGDVTAIEQKSDRRAREERIDRLREEFRELLRQNEVLFDKWRREGILPPEEPRRNP